MTWELEEAGDDAVTLHREDGLVLSARRVADGAGAADRPWTEWTFTVEDGGTGEQLASHGWEIVDEEHLWEVLDGFTHRFQRETAEETPAAASAPPAAGRSPTDTETEDGPADEPTRVADGAPEPVSAGSAGEDTTNEDSAGEGGADDESVNDERTDRPDAGDAPSRNEAPSAADSTDPAAAEPATDPESDPARDEFPTRTGGTPSPDSETETAVPTEPESTDGASAGAPEPTDAPEATAGPAPAGRATADEPPEAASEPPHSARTAEPAARPADPDVAFRAAKPTDAPELAAVYRSAYAENRELGFPAAAESATADDVRDWIEADGMLVAVAGDDVVGGVRLQETDPTRVKLSRLAVHDDWKGGGIGSELLDRAEAAVDAGRAETVWLTTPEDHPYLADMYDERGYERAGEYPLEDRDYDEIVMEKRLA